MKDFMVGQFNAFMPVFNGVIIHHHGIFHLVQAIKYSFMCIRKRPFRKCIAHDFNCFPSIVHHLKIIPVFLVENRIHPRPSFG